jgi:hypothetical protein
MPISSSQDEPRDSLQVIITPEGITFEGKRVSDFIQDGGSAGATEGTYKLNDSDLDEGGRRILSLFNTLVAAREKSELLKAKSPVRIKGGPDDGKPLPFDGVLAVTADKRIHYDTLRKIMYTAGAAGFKTFRFIALKKET